MNRFITLGIASTLVLASVAGAAFAAGTHDRDPGRHEKDPAIASHDSGLPSDDDGNAGYGSALYAPVENAMPSPQISDMRTDHIIRHWQGGRVKVVPVQDLSDTSVKASLEHRRANEPAQVAALKSAIEHNHGLAERLEARNIPIGSVIAAQAGNDGGITVYIR